MNLLKRMMARCVFLVRTETAPDGQGGHDVEWTEGGIFYALIRRDGSDEATSAQRREPAERFTVAVDRSVALNYHDVFRRMEDGAVFRVTSGTADGQAPEASTVSVAKASCERWVLT